MRIGLDGMPLAQARTGVGTYTFELARALAAAAPQDEFELISPLPFEQTVPAEAKSQNLELVYSRPNMLQRRWWTVGLPAYLRRSPPALFHGTNYDVPLRTPCSTVVTIHDLSWLLHSSTHEARAVRRARLRLPLMAGRATLIVTPSESVRSEVCEHLKVRPEKVFATPLAPRASFTPMAPQESEEVRKRLEIEDAFLLFAGTIEPRKNLSTLLRAFEQIVQTTDFRPQLVVAGKVGWKADEVLSQLRQSPVEDRVRLLGFVTDEDLRALYSSCHAFIYPSIYEGFGLPPLEAMACGAPVIATRVPSIKEPVARIVPATGVEELARNMIELLRDEAARRSLSMLGLRYSQQFSWERTAALTREVYTQALS
jgi:glycosyltransferase involved in cell wall biosynthesis